MKNILLTILVVAAFFVMMGCAGQKTTQTGLVQTVPAINNTVKPNASSEEIQTQPPIQVQPGGKAVASCNAGAIWSSAANGGSVMGTIVGQEAYKGKQACHVRFTVPGGAGQYDYYINMNDVSDICFVMSSGDDSAPTEVCNWQ